MSWTTAVVAAAVSGAGQIMPRIITFLVMAIAILLTTGLYLYGNS